MAVYYKFKSAKEYDSISIDSHFISVARLKYKIYEKKRLSRGTDFDLVVTNAQTNEDYLDEGMLIPKNTSVLIRRIPGLPRMPIIITPVTDQDKPRADTKLEDVQARKSSFLGADSSISKYPEDSEWDEFGDDLYAISEAVPVHSSKPVDVPLPSKADEDNKIRALIDTRSLDWQCQDADNFGAGRGFVRGRSGGRGFGRGGLLERTTPPPGYICHRCKVSGHFIQHCPTNGDPTFDIKRVKPPTGIPNSMLMATPDGSYTLPSGAVAVLKPNGAAFEKEIEGIPSTRSVGDLPPELYCPLCSAVMKDAVLTSKCCFKSFCDKCMRDYIISKSMCACGARNVLADDLLPNKTLRDTIIRILEQSNSSGNNGRSVLQPQDMESARCLQPKMLSPKITSPLLSAASKGGAVPPQKDSEDDVAPPQNRETTKIQEMTEPDKVINATQKPLDKVKVEKGALISEPTHDSRSVKEPVSQMSSQVADEEVQQKPVSVEVGKKKKKTARLPSGDMQWKTPKNCEAENYLMPVEPAVCNPYWNIMQPGIDGFGAPYAHPMPYLGYGLGPGPMPFGGGFPQNPFGAQGYMMPFLPLRDPAEFAVGLNGMGFNGVPPIMSREEFEARKASIKNKRDLERTGGSRELSRDEECGREMRGHGDVPSMNLKSKSIPQSTDNHLPRPRSRRPLPDHHTYYPENPHTSSKRKAKYDYDYYETHPRQDREKERWHQHRSEPSSAVRPPIPPETSDPPLPSKSWTDKTVSDRKVKAIVFARITYPEGESAPSKKQKLDSSSPSAVNGSNHHSNHSHSHQATSYGYHGDHRKSAASVWN